MGKILEGLEPEKVFYYFEKICRIPHGSGNTDKLSDFCAEFAKKRGLDFFQDEMKNIVIFKEATKGKEKSPTLVIQGHLDMVAEKKPDSGHDFLKDPLKLRVDGDYIMAMDTTLGGDDGIAIAYALAILDSEEIPHPKLEVVFTVEEETGMTGAAAIDLSGLNGKFLLNIDSEEEGVLTVGCAGGLKSVAKFRLVKDFLTGKKYNLKITGLRGGHSGIEIDKERANAIILMGRVLYNLRNKTEIKLVNISGGNKDNAIPREAESSILIQDEELLFVRAILEETEANFKKEFSESDPNIQMSLQEEDFSEYEIFSDSQFDKILIFLMSVPDGVLNMSMKIPGLVETSSNLGIIRISGEYLEAVFALRSSVEERKEALNLKIKAIAKYLGAEYTQGSEYPEWDYNKDSVLIEFMKKTYLRMYGEELKINSIHAGLECGYILQKLGSNEAVSFGPEMHDIHTTEEKISISSIKRTYEYLLEILKEI